MTYAIEKNVPREKIPRGGRYNFPLEQMEVEDSFFVPDSDITSLQAMRSALYEQASRLNWKLDKAGMLKHDEYGAWKRVFISRKVDGGVRVWRKL